MRHFEITGKLINGYGETVSITVYNKKSGDIFYIGLEQVEDLIDLVQRHLTSAMHSDSEGRAVLGKSSIPGDEETFNNGKEW